MRAKRERDGCTIHELARAVIQTVIAQGQEGDFQIKLKDDEHTVIHIADWNGQRRDDTRGLVESVYAEIWEEDDQFPCGSTQLEPIDRGWQAWIAYDVIQAVSVGPRGRMSYEDVGWYDEDIILDWMHGDGETAYDLMAVYFKQRAWPSLASLAEATLSLYHRSIEAHVLDVLERHAAESTPEQKVPGPRCDWCDQPILIGCLIATYYRPNADTEIARMSWDSPEDSTHDAAPCPGCSTPPGQFHHVGCAYEECPICYKPAIQCLKDARHLATE